MSKFDKFGNNDATFVEMKEKTATSTVTLKMVDVRHLMRCIYNKEDVSYTGDIEKSIDELGFIDPIEVMFIDGGMACRENLKCLEGMGSEHRYLILSGHRRYEAALKKGIKEVPCVQFNKKFMTDAEIENYTLVANCQRNSLRDPLLYYKRYIMHRDYYVGNCPEMKMADIDRAIAERMGTTDRNVRRFRAIDGNIIDPLLDMVRKEEIALSGLDRVAALTSEQQTEIYSLLQAILDERDKNGEDREISRSEVNQIVKSYKESGELLPYHPVMPMGNSQAELLQKVTELETVSKTADEPVRDDASGDAHMLISTDFPHNDSKPFSDYGNRRTMLSLLDKLSDVRGAHGCDWADLKSEDEAADTTQSIANAVMDLIDEIKSITDTYQLADKRAEVFNAIAKTVNQPL